MRRGPIGRNRWLYLLWVAIMMVSLGTVQASSEAEEGTTSSDARFDSAQEAAAIARERMEAAAQQQQQQQQQQPVLLEEEAVEPESVEQQGEEDNVQGEQIESVDESTQNDTTNDVIESTRTLPLVKESKTTTAAGTLAQMGTTLRRLVDITTDKAMTLTTCIRNKLERLERKDVKKIAAAAIGAWGIVVGVGYLTSSSSSSNNNAAGASRDK